jgi:hypothetical protein
MIRRCFGALYIGNTRVTQCIGPQNFHLTGRSNGFAAGFWTCRTAVHASPFFALSEACRLPLPWCYLRMPAYSVIAQLFGSIGVTSESNSFQVGTQRQSKGMILRAKHRDSAKDSLRLGQCFITDMETELRNEWTLVAKQIMQLFVLPILPTTMCGLSTDYRLSENLNTAAYSSNISSSVESF